MSASVRLSVPSPQTAQCFILRPNLRGLIGGMLASTLEGIYGGAAWGAGLGWGLVIIIDDRRQITFMTIR